MLEPEDAAALIEQTLSEGAVLIGGQAVAFWLRHFEIRPRFAALTKDIDYLGTRAEAKRASARLKFPHRLKLAALDDATPNSALLSVEMQGYPEPVLIDYLFGILGVSSKAIAESAVTAEFRRQRLRVLHPLQLLQAKIWNLFKLERKRTPEGIEQARLAIEIAAAFSEQPGLSRKERLRAIEAIGRFAASDPARYAREHLGLECLKAVPASVLRPGVLPAAFHEKRWPRIVAACRAAGAR